MSEPFSAPRDELSRDEQLRRIARETFDLAVIGGGINGAAIARDASMRGLRVALVDKGDFAGATSSRSSKLIHGGIRYLPQGQLRLVRSALRERERLRHRTAPHLVRPLRFLMPLYRGRGFGPLSIRAGLFLYDLFAHTPRAERHQVISADAVSAIEPALGRDRLRGGALYFDASTDDARLTIENALDAAYHGAAIANYVALEGFVKSGERLAAAGLRDLISGQSVELRARAFVNAAGPWVDDVRRLDDPASAPSVRLTKGVHLVVARDDCPVRNSLVLSDEGERIIFVMPHDRYVLIGTTDTDFDGDRERVRAEPSDVSYLLDILSSSAPTLKLTADKVVSSFAGLRALVSHDGSPSAQSREELITISASGLISVAGGKLTTHREIAQKVVDRVMAQLGRPVGKCPTLDTPLPGARDEPADSGALASLPSGAREILLDRYGTRAAHVAWLIGERAALALPLAPRCPVIGAEVIFAVHAELARTLADFMVRRTALIWRYPIEAEAAAPGAAHLMAEELGWSAERERAELASFLGDLRRRQKVGAN